ncbi:MAG: hypothetical protein QW320_12220, partial [Ignisphaera sp.]
TESVYTRVIIGRKYSVISLVDELYRKITETIIKEAARRSKEEEQKDNQQKENQTETTTTTP